MTTLRSIEIDFEVHKRIEMGRQGFEETPNDVLRRLLGIEVEEPKKVPEKEVVTTPAASPITEAGRPWAGKGITLPHGTQLRMDYGGRVYTGMIREGQWVVEGGTYKSPSAAAGAVAKTRSGTQTKLNGWRYWHVKRPGDNDWAHISGLRHRAGKT